MTTLNMEEQKKEITLNILEALIPKQLLNHINVKIWDGSYWPADRGAETILVLNYPGSLRAMLLPGTEVGLAEAYLYNDVDIIGEIEGIFELADHLSYNVGSLVKRYNLFKLLKKLPPVPPRLKLEREPARLNGKKHSIERDQKAVTYHYNVSNDFYSLWLDPNMVYSCGYFQNAADLIEKAQIEKLNYICKKLRLSSGQRLLDIGCGWGGLVICAAQNYGVDATGITLSQPQADYANKRIAELGLSTKARVLVQDYREVSESDPYDTLVSVGMFEHVGQTLLKPYFAKAYRLLKPCGVFMNHGIATTISSHSPKRNSFSEHYVFPDGELVPIFETLTNAELAGFEVRDVESLRDHYVLTLRQWVKRLEENYDRALKYVDESTYRVWRLYMSGSIYGFKKGQINVYQSLFVKPDNQGITGLPLTRADWYEK